MKSLSVKDNMSKLFDSLKHAEPGDLTVKDIINFAKLMTTVDFGAKITDQSISAEITSLQNSIAELRAAFSQAQNETCSALISPENSNDELEWVLNASEHATYAIMQAADDALHSKATNLEDYRLFVAERISNIFESCVYQDHMAQHLCQAIAAIKHIETRLKLLTDYVGDQEILDKDDTECKKTLRAHGPHNEEPHEHQAKIDHFFED